MSFTDIKHFVDMLLVIYSTQVISGRLSGHVGCSWWSGNQVLWTDIEYVIVFVANVNFVMCMMSGKADNQSISPVKDTVRLLEFEFCKLKQQCKYESCILNITRLKTKTFITSIYKIPRSNSSIHVREIPHYNCQSCLCCYKRTMDIYLTCNNLISDIFYINHLFAQLLILYSLYEL